MIVIRLSLFCMYVLIQNLFLIEFHRDFCMYDKFVSSLERNNPGYIATCSLENKSRDQLSTMVSFVVLQ